MGAPRAYEFITGIEASAQPDAGTPTLPNDLVTLSYISSSLAGKRKLVNTYAAPALISAATAIAPTLEAGTDEYLMFIAGNGAPVEMSANPQITAPGRAGIRLTLVGTDSTNTVTIFNGSGVAQNGPKTLGDKDATTWISIDAATWQQEQL